MVLGKLIKCSITFKTCSKNQNIKDPKTEVSGQTEKLFPHLMN